MSENERRPSAVAERRAIENLKNSLRILFGMDRRIRNLPDGEEKNALKEKFKNEELQFWREARSCDEFFPGRVTVALKEVCAENDEYERVLQIARDLDVALNPAERYIEFRKILLAEQKG